MDHLCPRLVLRQGVIQIAAGNFSDFVLRAHDDRELLRVMLLAPGPIADKGGKEAGKSIGLVRAGGFKVAPERFGTYIDAEDRLRERPPLPIIGGHLFGRRRGSLRPNECSEQSLLIPCFEGFEPDRAMVRFREVLHPTHEQLKIGRRTVQQSSRIHVQRRGESTQLFGCALPSDSLLAGYNVSLISFE
ncbi:MAG: hypothetical protein JW395_3775 [Nitrospira sp.]|nr:hypothetical protein [Nitrospira sp.]